MGGSPSAGSSPTTAFTSRRRTGDSSHGRRPSLAGLMEIRGVGICRLPYEPIAVVRLVVDLATASERMPRPDALATEIDGVRLPRLAVAPGEDAFLLVRAALTLEKAPA